eukprot:13188824-Alexandrium_andersonii.AAC.1
MWRCSLDERALPVCRVVTSCNASLGVWPRLAAHSLLLPSHTGSGARSQVFSGSVPGGYLARPAARSRLRQHPWDPLSASLTMPRG